MGEVTINMTTIITSHLTDQHVEEALSEAYIQTIAASARVAVTTRRHDHGIDGSFRHIDKIHGRRSEFGVALDFQLKGSKNWLRDSQNATIV